MLRVVLALIPTLAHADPQPSGPYRAPATAVLLSLGLTVGGFGIMTIAANKDERVLETTGAIAFFAGPTVGHAYAGKTWNPGLGVRLAGAGTVILGGVIGYAECPASCGGTVPFGPTGGLIALFGLTVYTGAAVYEIATAGSAANEFNRAHGVDTSIGVVPIRTPHGTTTPGFALTGHF